MASPFGHAIAGYAIGRLAEPRGEPSAPVVWTVCAMLAAAPDLDFVPGILANRPAIYHQTASHSLIIALAVGLAAAIAIFPDRARRLRGWVVFSAAYASHLAFDLFGADARPPIGIPLWWPFSHATYLAPWALLPGIRHADSNHSTTLEWVTSIFGWYNLRAVAIEVAVAGALLAATLCFERFARRSTAATAARGL